jgi:hypothetical protein
MFRPNTREFRRISIKNIEYLRMLLELRAPPIRTVPLSTHYESSRVFPILKSRVLEKADS